ncbi:toll/interleukin-1 receptor domain-containing protein [Prevotella communis]|uniref:toll/interleukin-1 receptor domain-containing protein n=1 Tax=Prevotella communis TaxID=2913614 RepID=UPI001EDA2FD8|nr:toll/interleukin-1 receptor domain-containing protein [Prevotella communis]UKK56804.1 toll/interleukin-1 receptor domain-containing protein [Prevotella communis]
MEPKELMTKRRIEKLASEYENYEEVLSVSDPKDGGFEVFVSHSSADNGFIRKVLLFLKYAKGGVNGYVDWQDSKLQHPTDAQTAKRLKDRIRNSRKMIYVVTNDSLKSVWCSWELGFADRDKGVDNVAILAVKPNNGRWKHNEYLQQYPWISYENNLFHVVKPNGEIIPLHEWLTK